MNFLEFFFNKIWQIFVHQGPVEQKLSIGLGQNLAPNRFQAIIWTNPDPVPHCHMVSPDHKDLTEAMMT